MNDLIVMLPFSAGDYNLALGLLDWIDRLGGAEGYDCVLVKDAKLPGSQGEEMRSHARKVFKNVGLTAPVKPLENERWPIGANWMFETALKSNKVYKRPFLWLEPDCVPMKKGWLQALSAAYAKAGKPFMGQIVTTHNDLLPPRILSGVAVYPKDAYARLVGRVAGERLKNAFDVAIADLVVPETHGTRLIWNFHGEKDLPPTFVEKKLEGQPRNALPLDVIPKQTVLFHRSKDGNLIKLLKERL